MRPAPITVPADTDEARLALGRKQVRLTHLRKPFWPDLGLAKRHLLQYYADVAAVLLPHLRGRAVVMKRYPDGVEGEFFYVKRAPATRPAWLPTCSIEHAPGNVVELAVVDDVAALLWLVNLGCIDLHPWYAPCDDVDRPDVLHFDLDPVAAEPAVPFARVREVAIMVRAALEELGMTPYLKTSGSRGLHVYVPIVRGPTRKQVWGFAKSLAGALARLDPQRITAEVRVSQRPAGRVLIDYDQNAWGRTLASVYSVRPRREATVSTPITWRELEAGAETGDFRIHDVPARVREQGDLWAPLLARRGRFSLAPLLERAGAA